MASKYASVNESPGIDIISGSAADADINTQLSVASKNPSRGFSSRRWRRVASEMSPPAPRLMAAEMMYASDCPSRVTSDVTSGSAYVQPKSASKDPRTCATPSMASASNGAEEQALHGFDVSAV